MITVKEFNKRLKKFTATITKMKAQGHQLACFSIVHALKHGDCRYINQFNDALTPGMQASFKRYVGHVCIPPDGEAKDSWLTYKNKEYIINTDVSEKDRKLYFKRKDETVEIEKPEEILDFPSFFDIDPDKEKNPFDDNAVLKQLESIARKASSSDSKVSLDLMRLLNRTRDKAKKLTVESAAA